MVELAPSGGLAHLSCSDSCGDLSVGWAAGARVLYRIHGVAIGGVLEHARFAWTPESQRESGALGVTLAGVVGRVYGEGNIVEPYAELGLGFPFVASTISAKGHPGAGLFCSIGVGLDVYVLDRLRVGPRAVQAFLFPPAERSGSAELVTGAEPPPFLPRLTGMQTIELAITYAFGR